MLALRLLLCAFVLNKLKQRVPTYLTRYLRGGAVHQGRQRGRQICFALYDARPNSGMSGGMIKA